MSLMHTHLVDEKAGKIQPNPGVFSDLKPHPPLTFPVDCRRWSLSVALQRKVRQMSRILESVKELRNHEGWSIKKWEGGGLLFCCVTMC